MARRPDDGIHIELRATEFLRLALLGPERVERAMAQAVYEEALAIFARSQRLVPVDTGALRGSGQVHEPERRGSETSVLITYGGVAAPYARIVHERDDLRHDPPTQSHYLERPALERQPHLRANIAERVARIIEELT